MPTYAIGDIHGCYQTFLALLEKINYSPQDDTLWFVGDLLNGGPDSLAVVRWVYAHRDRIKLVLGNHDLHALATVCYPEKIRPNDNFHDLLNAPDAPQLLHWLRHQPLVHYEYDHLLVHAGVMPQWSIAQCIQLSNDVQHALQSKDYCQFFHDMYGNHPDQWRDDLHGIDRLRIAINAITRMRIVSPQNQLEFKFKNTLQKIPTGFRAWFDAPSCVMQTTTIICGHWSALGLQIRPRLLAIDTGAVWNGHLTAIRLHDRKIFQVPTHPDDHPNIND